MLPHDEEMIDHHVIPAKAGISIHIASEIPAFAGMTR